MPEDRALPSSVLVAGCGYVGSALARELIADGCRVYGLRRRADGLPPGVTPVPADLSDASSLDSVPADVDAVVYAAAADRRDEEAYEAIYVRGLDNLLSALDRRGAPVRRVIFTSSTAVYGQDDGSWIDEESEAEPSQFSGRILLRAERLLAQAPYEGIALRLAGIYGPGRTRLVRRVARGEARLEPPGHPARYGNRIHRDDCAGAIRHLLASDRVEPVLVGVDDAPAPMSEVYAFVAELLGVAPPEPAEGPTGGRGGNKRCRNDRLKATGYRLRVPTYREGYPEIVRQAQRG